MGRNNTKAVKNIAKMYEQLGLAQDDIFHKTKLLLSIYRDVVWATLADCNCVNEEKTAIESGKRRIQDLDKLIERIYEDQVLGNISAERYARMSVNYENEQRTLINKVAEDEKKLACIEQTSLDLKTLLKVLRSSTSFEELTPTLVNSLIRRIEVHNNDKSSGHCYVKVDIYFTAIGLIDIPTEDEIKSLMAKIKANPQEYRLTA